MNYLAWLQFVQALAMAYAASQGQDARAARYLSLAATLASTPQATDAELRALMEEYQAKVANQVPTTIEELTEIDQRLAELSATIQSA